MEKRTRKPGKSWTHCRGIQEQFVEKILSGEKTTTIRPDAKDMEAGDRIKFFTGWRKLGALYRVTVDVVKDPEEFILGDYALTDFATTRKLQTMMFFGDGNAMENREEIAKKDGFTSFEDMVDFFRQAYPPKRNLSWGFEGKLISFANPRIEAK